MLLIETLKSKISDFLNSNTCFCSRLYDMQLHAQLLQQKVSANFFDMN